MLSFIKYLPLILRGRSIAELYKEETGTGKPIYISRRFIGALLAVIFAGVGIYTGVSIDETMSVQIADNIVTVITAIGALYGIILGIIGYFKRQK